MIINWLLSMNQLSTQIKLNKQLIKVFSTTLRRQLVVPLTQTILLIIHLSTRQLKVGPMTKRAEKDQRKSGVLSASITAMSQWMTLFKIVSVCMKTGVRILTSKCTNNRKISSTDYLLTKNTNNLFSHLKQVTFKVKVNYILKRLISVL